MAASSVLVNIREELRSEWLKTSPDLKLCGQLITKFMIETTKLACFQSIDVAVEEFEKDLLLTREVLELAILWSILVNDILSFERYMIQLKSFYVNYQGKLEESEGKYYYLSLNLMFLLTRNRIGEFHLELENFETKFFDSNSYVMYVVNLETHLMVGNYNKVFQMLNSPISNALQYFARIMLNTVRDEVAECIQKSYEKLSVYSAMEKLNFINIDEVIEFSLKKKWYLDDNFDFHFPSEENMANIQQPSQALNIALNAINYSNVLDTIV